MRKPKTNCVRITTMFALCQSCLTPVDGDVHVHDSEIPDGIVFTCPACCGECHPKHLDDRPVSTLVGEQRQLALA